MEKCIIVAVADNGAIGVRGELPWHLSEDLKYFKRVTLGSPVIMGRTTFDSIGRPLPGRKNIVLTSRPGLPETVCAVKSPQEAFTAAEGSEKCFVIGGATIYGQLLTCVDKLYVTHVHTVVQDADAFFPDIDPAIWKEASRSEMFHDEKSGIDYEFVVYSK